MFRQLSLCLLNKSTKQCAVNLKQSVSSSNTIAKNSKKHYTKHEKQILNDVFQKNMFVSQEKAAKLAEDMNRTQKAIQMWFAHKRKALKLENESEFSALELKHRSAHSP